MKNFEVARQFELMADILELKGENAFRIRAYRRAAQNLESLSEDIETVAREDRLEDIPGIGADLAGKIQEYLRTGRIKEIAAASKGTPRGVVALLNIPGIGPRTARVLYEREHITGIDQLEKRARKGGLRGLPGIQAKTEQNILKGIRLVRGGQERMPLGRALPLGRELVHALEGLAAVERISLAGSIRRMKETVGDIDILVTSSKPAAVMRAFTSLPQAAEVLERGTTKGSIRHREGIQVDLRVVEPECFGAALVYFTGSKQHNIHIRDIGVKKGLRISEYGVFRDSTGRRLASATEAEVYAAVGLPWHPARAAGGCRRDRSRAQARPPRSRRAGRDPGGSALPHQRDGRASYDRRAGDGGRAAGLRVRGGHGSQPVHARRGRAHRRRAGRARPEDPGGPGPAPADHGAGRERVRHPARRLSRLSRRGARRARPRHRVRAHRLQAAAGRDDAADLPRPGSPARAHSRASHRPADRRARSLRGGHRARCSAPRDDTARRWRSTPIPTGWTSTTSTPGGPTSWGCWWRSRTDTHMLDHLGWMELGVATARRGWTETRQVVNTWPPQKLLAWLRAERAAPARRAHGR